MQSSERSIILADNHNTASLEQWPRRCRYGASGDCIESEPGEREREDFCGLRRYSNVQSLQTLTTLNLWCNFIGDVGAEHLAAALKENRVSETASCSLYLSQRDNLYRRSQH